MLKRQSIFQIMFLGNVNGERDFLKNHSQKARFTCGQKNTRKMKITCIPSLCVLPESNDIEFIMLQKNQSGDHSMVILLGQSPIAVKSKLEPS